MGQVLPRRCSEDEVAWRRQRWLRSVANNNDISSLLVNAFQRKRDHANLKKKHPSFALQEFTDLYNLPPEIALEVLKNLNATDLCLAACVWDDLASHEKLWESLCKANWGYCSAYKSWKLQHKSFKKLYLILDEACLTFNYNPEWGINCLVDNGVLSHQPRDIALFIHSTNHLCWQKVRYYLRTRQDVFEELISLQCYKNEFLPNALRKFFTAVEAPTSDSARLSRHIDIFAQRFCGDNPDLNLTPAVVTIICFSLLLLSVDFSSPQVKNKMSKREFIRNICTALTDASQRNILQNMGGEVNRDMDAHGQAVAMVDKDFAGHLYDNIYLVGHVAKEKWAD